MANIDNFISSAAIRFGRLTDDVNTISDLMKDIRVCFIALTVLVYGVLLFVLVQRWSRYRRRHAGPRLQYDYQDEQPQAEYRNQTGATDDLVSVRSDSQVGATSNATGGTAGGPQPPIGWTASSRSSRHPAAAFMRHSRINSER
ncbi:hypothetical protein M3Y99_00762800 [Aphelenchoides fujianensis]|nr:hypothetical protein M3Y99_00762800 [Aphelenchoides fujianensis]